MYRTSRVFSVPWVEHSKTLREQGIEESEILLLKRKYFYSDANVDARFVVKVLCQIF
jgi:talin